MSDSYLQLSESPEQRIQRLRNVVARGSAYESLYNDERFVQWKAEKIDKPMAEAKRLALEAHVLTDEGKKIAEANILRYQTLLAVDDWQLQKAAYDTAREQLKHLEKGE